MSLQIEVGSFTQPGGTGAATINLVDSSLDLKALILWVTPNPTANGIVAHASMSLGFVTDRGGTISQNGIAAFAEDAIGTADTYRGLFNDAAVRLCDAAGAVDFELDVTQFNVGSFDVNWTNLHTTASITISYMAFGGDDVVDAEAGLASYTAATGAEDVTLSSGMGHPDVVFFARTARNSGATFDAEAAFSFGWGVRSGANNGRGIHWTSDDAATTEAVLQRVNNNAALMSGAAATLESVWTLAAESGWPTDGFEINKTTASFAEQYVFLAIRFSADVTIVSASDAAPTAGTPPVIVQLTSADTPRGALIAHTRQATSNTSDTTSADCGLACVGAMDDAGHEQWRGIWDDDGQGTASVASSAWSNTRSYRSYTPNNDTLVAEADGVVNGSNFNLSFGDVDSVATVIQYITFGELAVAAAGPALEREDKLLPVLMQL